MLSELHAIRPQGLPQIGNTFWPNGIPTGSSNTTGGAQIRFLDQNGDDFSICYTGDQIATEAAKWGYFSPYMPVLICCSTKSIKIDIKP